MEQQQTMKVKNDFGNEQSTSHVKVENPKHEIDHQKIINKDHNDLQYFDCTLCGLREKFEYFGRTPPFLNNYKLLEDAYVIKDPFLPPKHGKILVLGSHCTKCNNMVCKNTTCSIYFQSTFCIGCAKNVINDFPKVIQGKLNRIVI